jgi:uncharacterized protein YegP (UPF0339 family)
MTYEYYKDKKGEWRWRLVAANGRILADSGEGYKSEKECKDDINRVKNSKDAPVVQRSSRFSIQRAVRLFRSLTATFCRIQCALFFALRRVYGTIRNDLQHTHNVCGVACVSYDWMSFPGTVAGS